MNSYILLIFIILSNNLLATNEHFLASESIVGGVIAEEGHLTYQVSIQANRKHSCGGAIISKKCILTAAHCVTNETNGNLTDKHFTVISTLNALRPKSLERRVYVTKIYWLKKYIGLREYKNTKIFEEEADIAVLELLSELYLDENSHLTKLELPDKNFSHLHETLIIAGYGVHNITVIRNEENDDIDVQTEQDGKLRFAGVNGITNYECSRLYSVSIHHSNICARVVQLDSMNYYGICWGDSGSVLVSNSRIAVGVLDSGPRGCSEARLPGIYTKISHYLKFIRNAIIGKIEPGMRIAIWTEIRQGQFAYVEN